jgi:tetratricopeptide (TPR) repeat protein
MKNKLINVIRPIGNAAEKEYLKEFFRFIGCFLSDSAVDDNLRSSWYRALRPTMEEGGVDIVINYFGEDPFLQESRFQGIKRIYCYFSFVGKYALMTDNPLFSEHQLQKTSENNAILRRRALTKLISVIWDDEPEAMESIQNIAEMYMRNNQGDMFFYLQTRRSLRFLKMGEVLDEPSARVSQIRYSPHIQQTLEALWEIWVSLEDRTDAYSQYTQIKTAKMMRDVVSELSEKDRRLTGNIVFQGKIFQIPPVEILYRKLRTLIGRYPRFLSAHLYMAGLSRYLPVEEEQEEGYYLQILKSIPRERSYYAFLWYRLGRFYEKKHRDYHAALRYYRIATMVEPRYYQALFKLGYYAATDGRFKEAEELLIQTINSVFGGRKKETDEYDKHSGWENLSLKETQYVFKAYIMLAKVAINSNREYSAKAFIGKACTAASYFQQACLVQKVSTPSEIRAFGGYHGTSEPVWAMWKVLEPWSEEIILDYEVRETVRENLRRWPRPIRSVTQYISELQ